LSPDGTRARGGAVKPPGLPFLLALALGIAGPPVACGLPLLLLLAADGGPPPAARGVRMPDGAVPRDDARSCSAARREGPCAGARGRHASRSKN
jgi:hypothetical protein